MVESNRVIARKASQDIQVLDCFQIANAIALLLVILLIPGL
jgi:hypothetical protein